MKLPMMKRQLKVAACALLQNYMFLPKTRSQYLLWAEVHWVGSCGQ
jgi:hypothetical protein